MKGNVKWQYILFLAALKVLDYKTDYIHLDVSV